MNIKQIRNVTIIITYAGKKFLVDPMLAPKGLYPGIMGTPNSHLSNPLVELPVSLDEITNVDAIIVTHIHFDHIDEVALKVLPKNFCSRWKRSKRNERVWIYRCRSFNY